MFIFWIKPKFKNTYKLIQIVRPKKQRCILLYYININNIHT